MKLPAVGSALVGLACVVVGCATAVEDTSGVELHDGGHGGDATHVTNDGGGDAGGDTASSTTDSGASSRDSTTSFDTGPTVTDSGSSGTDTTIDFDSAPPPFDSGTGIDTAPPPTDGSSGGCTTDSDCTFPYNCCDTTSGNCSVYFGPICLPA